MEDRLLSPDETARFLGVDKSVLKYWRLKKRLGPPFIQLGRQTVAYRAADLAKWVESRRVEPAA